jgi:hypothetical protein
MTNDDYYFFDPYWDDTKSDPEEDCFLCGKAPQKCICDDEDLDNADYL